jgi:PAS domain S-box-containing protein
MNTKEIDSMKKHILDSLPCGYALINEDFSFLSYNNIFSKLFSFESSPDQSILPFLNYEIKSRIKEVFETGNEIVTYWTSDSSKISTKSYLINMIPLFFNEKINNILCLVNDNSENNHWHKEFNMLFEKVPAYISIVDKEFNVIRSNEKYKDTFGDLHSVYITDQSIKKAIENLNSPTALTFKEGREQVATQIGTTKAGSKIHLIVSSTPLSMNDDGVSLVMEISTDITELNQLQEQLHLAHDFYADLIESSADGIIAIDNKGKTQIFNKSSRNMLNWDNPRKPGIGKIIEILPEEFFQDSDTEGNLISDKEIIIKSFNGEFLPVRINAFELRNKKNTMGKVAFIQDLRRIKELENEKSKAEDEALTTTFSALENNIHKLQYNQQFLLDKFETLLIKGDINESENGWYEMRKKMNYIFYIVTTFMNIAKGFVPKYENIDIKKISLKVIDNLKDFLDYNNVEINYYFLGDFDLISADSESFEIILKILISNGIDSASENKINPKVMIVIEHNERLSNLIIEVTDNGKYIEPESLEKYFKVKDSDEARMGLLTVDMLVKKLGGAIHATSKIPDGNKFKIMLPLIKV